MSIPVHDCNAHAAPHLQESGLGWLNFKKSKLLAILGSSSGLVGGILKLRLFLDSMEPSFILLVKMGGSIGEERHESKALFTLKPV